MLVLVDAIRIFSSAENLRRVLRRMSRTAASLDWPNGRQRGLT
jgi:hypothetical protein